MRKSFPFALLAAVLYCIPVLWLLDSPNFSKAWLLYVGNGLFLCVLVASLFWLRHRNKDVTASSMVMMSIRTCIMGAVLAFILCWIMVVFMVPGLFHAGVAGKILAEAPAATIGTKTHGLLFMIFMDVSVGNGAAGLFVSIIFPFTLMVRHPEEEAS